MLSVVQLQMVFMCMGVDTKSQYLNAVDKDAQGSAVVKDEEKLAEIESLPEITKSVRNLFESGKIAEQSAEPKKVRIYESLPEWGVYESKPAQLEGVVRATDRPTEGDEIQRGMTSSLLSQWTRIGMDDNSKIDKPAFRLAYNAAPGSGIFESEPTLLDGVIRAVDNIHEERIQRGLTKSLLGQWSSVGKDEPRRSANGPMIKPTYEVTPGSGVFENEPTKMEGVVRESDMTDESEQIRRGMTKSLLSQWQNKGSEQPRTAVRRVITVAEGEGSISENEPLRRSDVVHSDDVVDDSEQVMRGMAKALLSEWKTKGTEGFQTARQAIIVAEDEGSVSENEPVRRSDVVHADDTSESEVIQRGTTKMLLGQWKSMGSGQSSKDKTPIVIAEGEGCVSENEPVRRNDVLREGDAEGEEIQRGITRSLLNQWKSMGSSNDDSARRSRTSIILDEAKGKVLESEPVRRTDVVHSDDFVEDLSEVQSGITRSLLNQWKNRGSEETKLERKPIVLNEAEGTVAESQPAQRRDDVVREDDGEIDTEQILRGTTKNLRSQWQNKASEEFRANKKPIVLAEAEGSVSENQPTSRLDITREAAGEPEEEQVQKGTTKSLLAQWKVKGTEEFRPEKRPIILAEAEDCVAENEPIKRTDVMHADDVTDVAVERGTTRSLLSQWKNKNTEEFKAERKPIVVAEDEGRVSESEPMRREGVVRADDLASDGEVVLKGYTRSLLTQWKNKPSEEVKIEKRRIIIEEDEGKIAESTPIVREGVVRCDDIEPADERVQRGFTKSLKEQWMTKGSEEYKREKRPINVAEDEGCVAENEPVRRSYVIHSDDLEPGKEVQSGMTRNLRAQWMTKGSEEFRREKKPIVIAEDEGSVAENEPVRRSDVIHSDDLEPGKEVQSGMTRNLRAQWMTKGSEEFRREKKPIVIAEDEGSVAENEPVRRSDIIHSDDLVNGDQIQRGITKNLKAQWISKGSEEIRPEKLPIVVAEGEGTVSENEPVRRSDVVHYEDVNDTDQVQQGITKNLRAQWMTKGSEKFQAKRLPIVVAEDGGTVSENDPVRRSDIVHYDDLEASDHVQKGFAKNLKTQWMAKGSAQYEKERKLIVVAEDEGKVAENQPVTRSDVVQSDTVQDNDQIQRGFTKNLRAQWLTKGSEEFKIDKAPIVLAEAEGTVAENDPVRRSDVIHCDELEDDEQIQRGITKNLRAQWLTKSSEEYHREKRPIVLAEAEGKVVENEPTRRSDVVHADDICEEGEFVQRGTTKSLLSRWSNPAVDGPVTERRPIVVAEDEGRILESEPTRRTDVVHAEDFDVETDVVQKGTTKSLLSQWKCKGTEEFRTERKAIIVDEAEGKVAENEPVRRSDVVHSDDVYLDQDQVQRGITRSLMSEWSKKGTEEFKVERKPIVLAEAEGKVAESEPIRRDDVVHHDDLDTAGEQVSRGITKNLLSQWSVKGSEEFVIERKKIVVAEGEGTVAENEPIQRSDVVKADDWPVEGEQIEWGMAKSLVSQWKNKGQEEFRVERKPIIVAEVEGHTAENEPVVRTDVVRSDDIYTEGETIRQGTTKSLLSQWKTKGTEEYKPKRKSIIIEDKSPTS